MLGIAEMTAILEILHSTLLGGRNILASDLIFAKGRLEQTPGILTGHPQVATVGMCLEAKNGNFKTPLLRNL